MMELLVGAFVGFFNANGMLIELLVAACMFAWWLEPRDGFWKRAIGGSLCMLVESVLWHALVPENFWTVSVENLIIFAMLAGWILQCWRVSVRQALFYFAMGGAMQHMVYRGARLGSVWLHRFVEDAVWIDTGLYALLQVPLYIVAYMIFARPLVRKDTSNVGSRSVFALLAGMLLCVSLFTNMFNYVDHAGSASYTVFSLFDLVTCIFMLELAIELVGKQRAREEGEVLRQLLRQQKQQLESSKETVDLINIKTHDLKKQIAHLGTSISSEQADELSDLVEIYDSSVRTGNETLDVLLVQKALLCEQRGIQFDRMVDGGLLDFMKPSDVYSLVGNALDNAMEAVVKIPPKHERYVAVRICESKGMVMIRVENPFVGELNFKDGLPITSKEDTRYHGFGMRSIRMLAHQYGGYMSVMARDGIFRLTVILPLQQR